MAKFSITSFLRGINTRVNKFRIQSEESVNSENVDLSNLEIKPQKGLDNTDSTFDSIDYKFKSYSVADTTADKFSESGDYLIKSYPNANAKFDRVWYDSSGNSQGLVGELTLGVPDKPPTPNAGRVSSATTGGTSLSYSTVKTSSYSNTTTGATADNSGYANFSTNHLETYGFTVFERYGNTVCMFDPTNKRLRRVDATTGNAPTNVNLDVTVTYADEYFFAGDYFVGLDSNYDNASIVLAATGNTSYDRPLNDNITGYQEYDADSYMPGIVSLTNVEKDFHVNDTYLFTSRSYRQNRINFTAKETTNNNTGSSYYYPAYYPKLDRPVMYIYSGWDVPAASNTVSDMHVSPSSTENPDDTVDTGWMYFGGYYNGKYVGNGRYAYFNSATGSYNRGSEYLLFNIGGVKYTCFIVSYMEAYGWWGGGYDIYDVVDNPNTSSTNYAYLWRLKKLHSCWIYPIHPGSASDGPSFIGATEIYAKGITSVGSITHQGDHTEGTHTGIPIISAHNSINWDGNQGYPRAQASSPPSTNNTQQGFNALATVVVDANGDVTSVTITDGGRGWQVGDVFEIPTSAGAPYYAAAGGWTPNIGGSIGVFGSVTAVDSTFKVTVQGSTKFQMDLSTGQITAYSGMNGGANTSLNTPAPITYSYPSSLKSMGSITRQALGSSAKVFLPFSDNVTDIPIQYGNWGSRYIENGINTYKPKITVNNRLNGANYPPARDNFLLAEKNYNLSSESSSYYVNYNNWSQVTAPIYLIPDDTSEFGGSTFSIPSSAPSTSGATRTDETIHSGGGTAILDGWYTMEANGVASSNDRVFNNIFGSSAVNVYSNILSSGATQFGTIQATLQLSNGGYDLVRQDGANAIFINTAGSGETVNVVNLQNLSVSTGTSFYGYGTNVKDIYKEGNYVIAKVGTNLSYVIDTANNNELAPVSMLVEYPVKVDTSNLKIYGVLISSSTGKAAYVNSAYFFFRHEILALGTGGIREDETNSANTRNIGAVFHETTNSNIYHIGYISSTGTFDRTQSTYNLGISTTRRPKITLDAFTENFTANWDGTKLVDVPNGSMHSTIVGDVLTIGSVTATVTGYSTDANATIKGILTFTGSSGSQASGSLTVTRTRYTHRNRMFAPQSEHGNLTISTPTFNSSGTYAAGSNEPGEHAVTFGDISGPKFIVGAKTSSDYYTKSGSSYFSADLDRRIVNTSSSDVDIADSSYSIGGMDIYNSVGANIPFQYKISYLRDIRATTDIAESTTNESDPVLIEGPTSDETGTVTLSNLSDSINISSLGSSLASDIAKVRLYRVGGDYARYYWLTDLDVSNSAVGDYDDFSLAVGSTLISPNDETNAIPLAMSNIVQVNGLFVGSVGSHVYFSEFGNPHSWPESGKYEIDGAINNIVESDGEAIIFTDNSIFRARGFSYDTVNIASIPQSQGVNDSNKDSVVKHLGSVFFISNDGLCEYKAGVVRVISQPKFSSFPEITTPRSVFKDGVLYIFEGSSSSSNKGMKVDFRTGEPVFSRIDQKALTRVLYNQANDTIYVKNSPTDITKIGSYGSSGDDLSILHESGEIGLGDLYSTKILFKAIIKYKTSLSSGSNATVKFYADGSGSEFFTASLSDSTTETCLYFPLQTYESLKYLRYKIEGKVTVYEINFDYEMAEAFMNKVRLNHVDVQYTGQLKVDIYADNGKEDSTPNYETTGSTNMPNPSGAVRTVRLYYPSDTTAYIPHIYYTGAGRVISTSYGTEDL